MTIAAINHIVLDDRGVARIAGSRIKVIHLIMEKQANSWSADDLHDAFPHLSLAAIHAALSYYYDHQPELDAAMEEDFQKAEAMRKAAGESPLAKRLRSEGRIP